MKDKYNIFDYYLASSHIHNLSSIYKLLSIILLIIALINTNNYIDIGVITLYIFVVMLWSNISIRLYISNLLIFKLPIILIFVLVSIISLNIFTGLLWLIKIIDLILYLIIITITTSLNDVVNGVYRIFKPFKRILDVNEIALMFGVCFKFFNIYYSEFNRVKISKKLRGVKFNDMSFFDRLDFAINGIKPIFNLTLQKLDKIKNNMYIKGYGISKAVSDYRLNKWRKTDTILLVINLVLIIVAFIY